MPTSVRLVINVNVPTSVRLVMRTVTHGGESIYIHDPSTDLGAARHTTCHTSENHHYIGFLFLCLVKRRHRKELVVSRPREKAYIFRAHSCFPFFFSFFFPYATTCPLYGFIILPVFYLSIHGSVGSLLYLSHTLFFGPVFIRAYYIILVGFLLPALMLVI